MFDRISDKRNIPRWQISRQAQLQLEGEEHFVQCCVRDINFKGMQVCSGIKLGKDSFIKFKLFLAEDYILEVQAWVVWHKTVNNISSYGLYFERIKDGDKEKICEFIREFYPREIHKQYCPEKYINQEKGGEKMPEENLTDKRIFARFPVSFPLRFLDLNSNKEEDGQLCDFSAKGVGFVAKQDCKVRTPLELWLKIPDQGEPLYTRGEVVWSAMVNPSQYRIGVALEKADLMGLSRVLRLT